MPCHSETVSSAAPQPPGHLSASLSGGSPQQSALLASDRVAHAYHRRASLSAGRPRRTRLRSSRRKEIRCDACFSTACLQRSLHAPSRRPSSSRSYELTDRLPPRHQLQRPSHPTAHSPNSRCGLHYLGSLSSRPLPTPVSLNATHDVPPNSASTSPSHTLLSSHRTAPRPFLPQTNLISTDPSQSILIPS